MIAIRVSSYLSHIIGSILKQAKKASARKFDQSTGSIVIAVRALRTIRPGHLDDVSGVTRSVNLLTSLSIALRVIAGYI